MFKYILKILFTLKVRYLFSGVSFDQGYLPPDNRETEWGYSTGYVAETEENRCARERAFNVKMTPTYCYYYGIQCYRLLL